jgi:hypothetical protein
MSFTSKMSAFEICASFNHGCMSSAELDAKV